MTKAQPLQVPRLWEDPQEEVLPSMALVQQLARQSDWQPLVDPAKPFRDPPLM